MGTQTIFTRSTEYNDDELLVDSHEESCGDNVKRLCDPYPIDVEPPGMNSF